MLSVWYTQKKNQIKVIEELVDYELIIYNKITQLFLQQFGWY